MRLGIPALLAAGLLLAGLPASADARDVRMIAPEIPPHFDRNGNGRIGDVVRAALERCGHRVQFVMVPFGRHWKDYADDPSFDALATAEADQTFPGHSTKPFIHLQDGATVRPGSLGTITSAEQLAGMRVVAFPAADKILGIEALVPRFRSFTMRADRFDQLRPLYADRVDAVLADGLITATFVLSLRERAQAGQEPGIDPSQPVVFRRIFAAGPQRLYFRDAALAADFDRCVAELRTSGELLRIARPYVDRLRAIVGDQYPDD